MRVIFSIAFALSIASQPAWADDFPRDLVQWSPIVGNPVFQRGGDRAWDKKIRERGYILLVGNTYHLWYTGYNDDLSPKKFLGHATSGDGIHWNRDAANPIFTDLWVEDVCVLRYRGEFVMFAEGKDDIAHQLSSRDGVHWRDEGSLDIRMVDGSPISKGAYGTPTVWVEDDGTWYLFYERGDKGVWLATSKDRTTWTNIKDTPVLAMGPEPYDRTAVAVNQIIKRDGVYYAFYHANAFKPWKDWTTNVARSKDLVHWEKNPGNPIIGNNCSSAILVRTPEGDRLYTMHPDVKVFRPAARSEAGARSKD